MTSLQQMIVAWTLLGGTSLLGCVWGLTAFCVAAFLDGDWDRLDAMLGDALE